MKQADCLILYALEFAAHKHRDQRRKDPEASPYINHPIALVNVLCNEGHVSDTATLCAAVLHDTIEDTQTTSEELLQNFGEEICQIVLDVTDDKSLPSAEQKRLQIVNSQSICVKAKLVKLADKICNLRDIASSPPVGWTLQRRQDYFDWAKAVVDQLRGVHDGLEKIFDTVFAERPEGPT